MLITQTERLYLKLVHDYWLHSRNKNTEVDNAKDTGVIMQMYNLLEYNNNYLKTSAKLFQWWQDGPALNSAGAIFCWNNMDISDILKSYNANINGMWNAKKKSEINQRLSSMGVIECLEQNIWK